MRHVALLVLSFLALLGGLALAGPSDARVGEVRAVFLRKGTRLRPEPKGLVAPTATLASRQRVVVREVKLPWLRVQTVVARGAPTQEGWLRAAETVEPSALAPNPAPRGFAAAPPPGTTQRDISVAGRQFGPETERRYRASQPQLQRAYALVDQMEAATRGLDPAERIAFIRLGSLGQKGQDLRRPPLLPATIEHSSAGTRRGGGRRRGGGLLGGLGGGVLDKLGSGLGGPAKDVLEGLGDVAVFASKLQKSFTPVQEYYLGRAVAAQAIARFGLDPNEERRQYVRQVGDAVVRLTRRLPANYGGYHFDVLDSDEINGISGPGGFVLITRGAVEAAKTEDDLAAFLTHELAHVRLKHGEETLRRGKNFQAAVQGLARFGARQSGVSDGAIGSEIVRVFSTAVSDAARTSIEHGYGRNAEFAADLEGTYVLVDVVYDHHAMQNVLRTLAASSRTGAGAATHAGAALRAQQLDPVIRRYGAFARGERVLARRLARFNARLGRSG